MKSLWWGKWRLDWQLSGRPQGPAEATVGKARAKRRSQATERKGRSGTTAIISTDLEPADTVRGIASAAEGPAAVSTEAVGADSQVALVIYPAVVEAIADSFKSPCSYPREIRGWSATLGGGVSPVADIPKTLPFR